MEDTVKQISFLITTYEYLVIDAMNSHCLRVTYLLAAIPSRPRDPLLVVPLTRSTARLSWRAPASDGGEPVDRYRVEWQHEGSAGGWSNALDTASTEAIVEGLATPPHAALRFRVSARNRVGFGEPLESLLVPSLDSADVEKESALGLPRVSQLRVRSEADASLRLSWRLEAAAAAARGSQAEPVEYAVELWSRSTRLWAEQSRVKHTSSSDEHSLSGWRPKAAAEESLVRVVPIFAKGRRGLATFVDLPLPATQALAAPTPLVQVPSTDARRGPRDARSVHVEWAPTSPAPEHMVLEARQYSRAEAEADAHHQQSDVRAWRSVLRAPAAAGHVKLELATLAPGFHYEFRLRAERDGALGAPSAPFERLYVEGTCTSAALEVWHSSCARVASIRLVLILQIRLTCTSRTICAPLSTRMRRPSS